MGFFKSVKGFFAEAIADGKKQFAEEQRMKRLPEEALNQVMEIEWKGFTPLVQYGILAQAMFKEFLYNGPLKADRFSYWQRFPGDQAVFTHFQVHAPKEAEAAGALEKEWGIISYADFLPKISWILEEGQTAELRILIHLYFEALKHGLTDPLQKDVGAIKSFLTGKLEKEGIEALTDKSVRNKLIELREKHLLPQVPEEDGYPFGLAFDLARISVLWSDAFIKGWVTREEILQHFSDLGKIISLNFETWDEFGQDFLLAANFWMPTSVFRDVNLEWYEHTIRWLQEPDHAWGKHPLPNAIGAHDQFLASMHLNYPELYQGAIWEPAVLDPHEDSSPARFPTGFFTKDQNAPKLGYDWRGRQFLLEDKTLEIRDPALQGAVTMELDEDFPGIEWWLEDEKTQNEILELPQFRELLFWKNLRSLPEGKILSRKPYAMGEFFYDPQFFELKRYSQGEN